MGQVRIASSPIMINFRIEGTSPRSLSPLSSLPRPPRCLTPYPNQAQFHSPISRSPLPSPSSSPGKSPTDSKTLLRESNLLTLSPSTTIDPFNSPILQPKSQPSPSKKSVPINLRMTSISPTDSSFSTPPPGLVSPRSSGSETRMIPLSPSAKKYMEAKHGRKERPDPIVVPLSTKARSEPRVRIATPTWSDLKIETGSVPLPKTPKLETPARTAMPLTSRRIGVHTEQESVHSLEVFL